MSPRTPCRRVPNQTDNRKRLHKTQAEPDGVEMEPATERTNGRRKRIRELAERIRAVERSVRLVCAQARRPLTEAELGPLAELFPNRRLEAGLLVEWLSDGEGRGAATLAVLLARAASAWTNRLVVVDDSGLPSNERPRLKVQPDTRPCSAKPSWGSSSRFYLPAVVGWSGAAAWEVVVVRAEREADRLWALEQALRCPAVAVVLARVGRVSSVVLRRLQLAAEATGGLGLLLRPASVKVEPSWAAVRFEVQSVPECTSEFGRRLRVTRLYCRGHWRPVTLNLEVDHATGSVRLAAELPRATAASGAAGA